MPVTKYAVRRKADGYFWKGGTAWGFHTIGALWFDSMTLATFRAIRDLSGMDLSEWSVEPIAEVRG